MIYSRAHTNALKQIEELFSILDKIGAIDKEDRILATLKIWCKGLAYYHESFL
jgi:hypothetical protein